MSEQQRVRIFGRDPALWIGLIGAVVTVVVATGVPWLDAGAGAAVTGFVSAAVIALTTRPWQPALFTGVVTAAAALFAEYGLELSDDLVAGLSALILATFAIVGVRPQVEPRDTPVSRA